MRTTLTAQPFIPEIRGCLTKAKKSQYYQAILTYTDGAGCEVRKSRSTRQTRKSDAYRVMMQMIQDEKDSLKSAAPGTIFVDFLRYWLNEVIVATVEDTTWNGYRMNLENHVIPFFEPFGLRLRDIRPLHIQRFIEAKLKASEDGKVLKASFRTTVLRKLENGAGLRAVPGADRGKPGQDGQGAKGQTV